ncbi:iron uptake protein [Bordetella genomosp. 13]|nr:iron uptake protein [Bordetella genomosp. 13]
MKTKTIPDGRMVAGGRGVLWARAVVVIVFAYGFAWGVCALGAVLLARAGMARSEAVMVFAMAGFLVYLVAALWAIATRRLLRTALVLGGGGLLLTLLARVLAQHAGAA